MRQLTHLKLRRRYAAPVTALAICFGGFCNSRTSFLANQDYVWGYGSVICGGYLCFLVCSVGAEEVRTKFLNAYSAENGDFKVPRVWSMIVSLLIPFQIFMLFMWWFEQAARESHWNRNLEQSEGQSPNPKFTVSVQGQLRSSKFVFLGIVPDVRDSVEFGVAPPLLP